MSMVDQHSCLKAVLKPLLKMVFCPMELPRFFMLEYREDGSEKNVPHIVCEPMTRSQAHTVYETINSFQLMWNNRPIEILPPSEWNKDVVI